MKNFKEIQKTILNTLTTTDNEIFNNIMKDVELITKEERKYRDCWTLTATTRLEYDPLFYFMDNNNNLVNGDKVSVTRNKENPKLLEISHFHKGSQNKIWGFLGLMESEWKSIKHPKELWKEVNVYKYFNSQQPKDVSINGTNITKKDATIIMKEFNDSYKNHSSIITKAQLNNETTQYSYSIELTKELSQQCVGFELTSESFTLKITSPNTFELTSTELEYRWDDTYPTRFHYSCDHDTEVIGKKDDSRVSLNRSTDVSIEHDIVELYINRQIQTVQIKQGLDLSASNLTAFQEALILTAIDEQTTLTVRHITPKRVVDEYAQLVNSKNIGYIHGTVSDHFF